MKPYIKYVSGRNPRIDIPLIKKHITNLKNATVLDIGGGNGVLALSLSPMVKSVYVVDPSKAMLNSGRYYRRKHNISNVKFYKGSAEKIPLSMKFNIIIMKNSFHFVKDKNKAWSNMKKLLKSRGIIYIQEPEITTTRWGSPMLIKGHPKFNKEIYNRKKLALQKSYRSIKNQKLFAIAETKYPNFRQYILKHH